jgi:hypothetical protein
MPSDPCVRAALDLLAAPAARFQNAVAATLEEIRGELALMQATDRDRADRLTAQLGPFAQGRLDGEWLAKVLGGSPAWTPGARKRLEAACDALEDIVLRGSDLLCVTVPSGTAASAAIAEQLSAIGCAFGAARVATAVRGRRTSVGTSDKEALTRFPFAEWTVAERRLAPPLVVMVAGRDLDASSLACLLDGALKIVLIVDGPAPTAPLVRLITPNTFVMQTHELDTIAPLADWPGTGIAALMPLTAAAFVHEPNAGAQPWQRVTVTKNPDVLGRIAGFSAVQQQEEILQLEALATKPAANSAAPAPSARVETQSPTDEVDRLAAWLLQQADLMLPGERS